jgi:transcriptional regulator with XRE-family HTH domain
VSSGNHRSILLLQVSQTIRERGIRSSTLASALGVTAQEVDAWLAGTAEPTLSQYEQLMALLRLVPVVTSVDKGTAGKLSLRDFLNDDDAEVFDQLSDNSMDVLRTQLRDLQMQRIRIEEMHQDGTLEYETYIKLINQLSDSTRFTVDSIGKLDVSDRMSSGEDVETCYGSPKGPAYDKEAVDKVRAADAAKEKAKCQDTETSLTKQES